MKNTLVIGYGNTLRGDDGVAILAVEILKKEYPQHEYISLRQPIHELAEVIINYKNVIFIDASIDVKKVTQVDLSPQFSVEPVHTHILTPQQLLNLCLYLYGKTPQKAILFHIPAYQFEFLEDLSPKTKKKLKEFLADFAELNKKL